MIEEARVSDNRLYKFKRNGKAAIAGGLAALALMGIACWGKADVKDLKLAVAGAVCAGLPVMLLGAVVGVVGASVGSLNHASLIGAAALGLFVGFPVLLRLDVDGVWLLVAICSFGSILAQAGAVAGGTARGDEAAQRTQFTLGHLLAFFIPVALYLGYVSGHMRK